MFDINPTAKALEMAIVSIDLMFIWREYSPNGGADVVLVDELCAGEMIGDPSNTRDDDREKLQTEASVFLW